MRNSLNVKLNLKFTKKEKKNKKKSDTVLNTETPLTANN